ncbi:hypothetical protein MJI47_26730, partial [Salmonella enterica subsp. enterica serovar Kentucky]|nr:hypothetical protein [Salmonella enterica subsp. enterica serovar Kentucky]
SVSGNRPGSVSSRVSNTFSLAASFVRQSSAFFTARQHSSGPCAKEAQPEAYIVGEHFGDARQWLQADAEDAAMNYRGFTFPLWG